MIAHGWKLYVHHRFERQYRLLVEGVGVLAAKAPVGYQQQPLAKLLSAVQRLIFDAIPRNPNAEEFRQGNTLGVNYRQWFRAKFHQRFRLFFRFSSKEKVIVYAWMNDERTLRKAGAKTDPYRVFREMLIAGDPPRTMEELLAQARELKD
jgi:toxin YhaV